MTPSLNDYKESFAEAYVFAIAAAAGITIERTTHQTDNAGIDLTLCKRGYHIPGSQINIQLKGVAQNSGSMLKVKESSIAYNFDRPCQPVGVHYLVVVILPSDIDDPQNWITLTDEQLILKKCAYYSRIVSDMKPGFVEISKKQILTHNNLPNLFFNDAQLIDNL